MNYSYCMSFKIKFFDKVTSWPQSVWWLLIGLAIFFYFLHGSPLPPYSQPSPPFANHPYSDHDVITLLVSKMVGNSANKPVQQMNYLV